jgi:hypothetical protein
VFKPDVWDDTTFVDRRNDLEAVIADLLSSPEFQQLIDSQAIGAAGHSLGGYTVVGLAGGWSSWFDSRIQAVVALSLYVMPYQVKKTLGNVHVPLIPEPILEKSNPNVAEFKFRLACTQGFPRPYGA